MSAAQAHPKSWRRWTYGVHFGGRALQLSPVCVCGRINQESTWGLMDAPKQEANKKQRRAVCQRPHLRPEAEPGSGARAEILDNCKGTHTRMPHEYSEDGMAELYRNWAEGGG